MESKLESTPRLRFTDENNEPYPKWEEKKLGEMGGWKPNSGFAKKHINPEGETPLILYGELYTRYDGKSHISEIDSRTSEISTRSVSPGDLLFPSSGETKSQIIRCLTVSRKNDTPIYTSGDLLILSPSTEFIPYSLFMSSYINSPSLNRKMRTKAQGNSVVHMSKGAWGDCSIPLPSLPEQEKIGEFLSALDDEVEQTERLVSLLSDRKRAYAQRIFNKTLRFHDDNGNPYPEWEEKKLGDVLSESREEGTNGEIAKKMTVKLWGKGVFAKKSKGSSNTVFFKRSSGQLIYSKLDFLNGAFGIIPSHLDGYETTADMPAFNIDRSKVDRDFLINLVCRKEFYSDFAKDTGSNRKAKRINQVHFLNKQVPLPSIPEQEKIGSFLSALDDEIDEAKRELELLKEQKKAYAQIIFGV